MGIVGSEFIERCRVLLKERRIDLGNEVFQVLARTYKDGYDESMEDNVILCGRRQVFGPLLCHGLQARGPFDKEAVGQRWLPLSKETPPHHWRRGRDKGEEGRPCDWAG